jgi:hypothetical protein
LEDVVFRVPRGVEKLLELERAQLPSCVVVGFGAGIAGWFALGEPWQWKAFVCPAAAMSAGPDLLIRGDGRHLPVVISDGTPFLLRDHAGDYIRSLLAEASGFAGDPGELGSMPFTNCSDDARVAIIPKPPGDGACGRSDRLTGSAGRIYRRLPRR